MPTAPSYLEDLPALEPGRQPAPGPLDVHIWWHGHDPDTPPERIVPLLTLLSSDERKRFAHLHAERRQRQFLVGRALCRRVLSLYAPVRPEDWRFALGRRGKPSVATPLLSAPLWFSLSHADGMSVCAVTGAGPDIGIDVERIASGVNALEIADQFFPKVEVRALRGLPEDQQGETFLGLWALKESYAKAREASLADGLAGTIFDLACPDDIGVAFADSLHEPAEEWQFRLHRLKDALLFALAVRSQANAPMRLSAGNYIAL